MFKILKNIFTSQLYAMSLYARQIAGTVVLLLIVRFLSVYDYGLFSSYNNIVVFCLLLANPGLSEYILVSSQNKISEIQLKIGLFIIYSLLVTFLIYIGSNFTPLESKLIFTLVLIRAYLDGTQPGILFPYFQASKKFNLVSYINLFYSIMTVIFAFICYYFHLSLIKFLCMGILLGIINIVQYSYHAKINYILVFKNIFRLVKKVDKSILSYIGTAFVFFAYNKIPGLYVSTFIPKEQAALFFSAFAVANILLILLQAQYQKMIPEMIKTSVADIKKIIKKNLLFMLSINIILLVVFYLWGDIILLVLYSKEYYVSARPYLLLLTIGNIILSIASVYGAYMTASGNQNIKMKMMFIASIITIASISIVHRFGLYSAILAYIISASFLAIVYLKKSQELLSQQLFMEVNTNVKR